MEKEYSNNLEGGDLRMAFQPQAPKILPTLM